MIVRHPIWLKRLGAPGAEAFAILFALESFARALLTTVIPLEALRIFGDAQGVSLAFFAASLVALGGSLAVPALVRLSARRWIYTLGALSLAGAPAILALGGGTGQVAGMMLRVLGVVTMTICMNLYIMDHISRRDFSRSEPMRVFYSAGAWAAGPFLGVALAQELGLWAVYGASSACALGLLAYFWFLRLGDNPIIAAGTGRAPGIVANIRRFFAQPRLVLAWLISVSRNAWWAMFFIYVPIYAIQSGLGAYAGGMIVSLGSGLLFSMPLWGWCVRRYGLRRLSLAGFATAGLITCAVALFADWPWVAAVLLVLAALAMVSLDAVGNVPFMLAVRARERPAMTSVYSTYRDVADLVPPGVFSLVLNVFALPAVFATGGIAMLAMALVSRQFHPRLGRLDAVTRHQAPGRAAAA